MVSTLHISTTTPGAALYMENAQVSAALSMENIQISAALYKIVYKTCCRGSVLGGKEVVSFVVLWLNKSSDQC